MKKRILSILLILCMVLMLCPVAAFADENYMITQNFKYGTRTYDGTDPQTSPYQFVIPAGGSFSLGTIEDCSPYELVGWKESVSGTVYLPYAEIQNLQSDLTFDAVYQVQGGLTITVDGFMPGNTPNDCTYTFESTIPGVTFDEKDITYLDWKILWAGQWEPISETEAFEAGIGYRFGISLKNNGLELVPATTANGIAPMYRQVVSNNGGPYAINMEFELGTPVAPTLAVTVDNFEVGKTPNDITYSFASTNLGVTFSEEDIKDVIWLCYDPDSGQDYAMVNTEMFEADRGYRCKIELDNKGLTEAPAVTVNGQKPHFCNIRFDDGKAVALMINCALVTPAPAALTISGPDVVCAQQYYEFTVTPADGVTLEDWFWYENDDADGYAEQLTIDEDGVGHGVVSASEYDDADRMVLNVSGAAADGTPVFGTKAVEVSPEHIYVDGVCGCGAVREYTIEYVWGDAESTIPSGVKTHGVAFTLSSETFTRDGYIQTGWHDEYSREYELGGVYTLDEDMMFFPVWEKLVTVTVPFTTTVALGDAGEPGETTFELALIDGSGAALTADNVTAAAAVTTDGAGDYTGALTITGPEWTLWRLLSEGAFVQQVNAGEDGWTVDDTVWGVRLYMPEVAARSADEVSYELLLYPTYVMDDGCFNLDLNAGPVEEMTFTNTYTAHVYALNHDADGHWDECAGCKDVQNKEPHKYGDWKVTKEATQTAKGEKEHTCTVCGYTEKAEIPVRTNVPSGDDSSFALWAALFTLSAAAVITTATVSKKKKASK